MLRPPKYPLSAHCMILYDFISQVNARNLTVPKIFINSLRPALPEIFCRCTEKKEGKTGPAAAEGGACAVQVPPSVLTLSGRIFSPISDTLSFFCFCLFLSLSFLAVSCVSPGCPEPTVCLQTVPSSCAFRCLLPRLRSWRRRSGEGPPSAPRSAFPEPEPQE